MRSSSSAKHAVFVVSAGSLFMAGSNVNGLLFRKHLHSGIDSL